MPKKMGAPTKPVSKTKQKLKSNLKGAGPGRPKGSKDKVPNSLKKKMFAIMADLEKKGKGLGDCADESPKWFYENFIKPMLPKNVDLGFEDKDGIPKIIIETRKAK